jgi:hypothetical protein
MADIRRGDRGLTAIASRNSGLCGRIMSASIEESAADWRPTFRVIAQYSAAFNITGVDTAAYPKHFFQRIETPIPRSVPALSNSRRTS